MSGPGQVWEQVAEAFGRQLSAVTEDQWSASTPCSEWTVRELVDHTIATQCGVGGALGAKVDPSVGWDKVADAVGTAMGNPANFEGAMEGGPFAGMPKHQVAGLAVGDLLLHTWDLAKAIGGDTTLPPEAVEAVHLGLSRMPPQMMRGSGRFGDEVEVPQDASAQDKMIAFSGRQP